MATMSERVHELGITIENRRTMGTQQSQRDYPGGHHWSSTLRMGSKRLTVPFHQGSAWKRPPNAEEVLNALALDSSGYDNTGGFADWASEYGFSLEEREDRRHARMVYDTVGRQRAKLMAFLSAEDYDALLYHTEPL